MIKTASDGKYGKYSNEMDHIAKLGLVFGLPSVFVTFFLLRLSNLEQDLINLLRANGLVTILFPGPTVILAIYVFLFFLMILICSVVAYATLPKEKSSQHPVVFLITPIDIILIIGVSSVYFANILWRIVWVGFNLGLGWSILAIVLGILPTFILIPVFLDLLFYRLWMFLFGSAPGIFKGKFHTNLRRALRKKIFKKEIAEFSKIFLVGIPILVIVEIILVFLDLI